MKQDQHCQGNKRIKSSSIQSRAIIGQNNSIVSDTNDPKNQQNHDRAQSTQSSAELEHVPRHRSSRSMHTQQTHHDSAPKLVTFPPSRWPHKRNETQCSEKSSMSSREQHGHAPTRQPRSGKKVFSWRRAVLAWSVGSVNLGFMEKIGLEKGDFDLWVQ